MEWDTDIGTGYVTTRSKSEPDLVVNCRVAIENSTLFLKHLKRILLFIFLNCSQCQLHKQTIHIDR
jgi:hypothetical protein